MQLPVAAAAGNQICQIACTTCRQVGGASCRRRKAKGAEKVTRLSGCQNDSKRFHLTSMLNSTAIYCEICCDLHYVAVAIAIAVFHFPLCIWLRLFLATFEFEFDCCQVASVDLCQCLWRGAASASPPLLQWVGTEKRLTFMPQEFNNNFQLFRNFTTAVTAAVATR